jgi:hypothetical protein
MTTKMKEALIYFEPVIEEVGQVLAAFLAADLQPENRVLLTTLQTKLRKGWDVLGNQIVLTSHCQRCRDNGVVAVDADSAVPCPDCSVGTSVDEQAAELEKARQWVVDRLVLKEWTCQKCGKVNTAVCCCCLGCGTWRP